MAATFTVLNSVVRLLWRNKPPNVQCPKCVIVKLEKEIGTKEGDSVHMACTEEGVNIDAAQVIEAAFATWQPILELDKTLMWFVTVLCGWGNTAWKFMQVPPYYAGDFMHEGEMEVD